MRKACLKPRFLFGSALNKACLGWARQLVISWQIFLLRGTILNRTYGTHKNLYISLFLLSMFGSIYYGPPQ